ncbi:MAG: TonB-dependent receptor [Gemmatimonadaceae bacterium]|nr:TonB-dependent receptor [Gemmatimonadaceae bacterium]
MLRTLLGTGLLLGTLWPSSTKIHAQSADASDHGPRFLYAPSPTSALRDARNAPVLKRRISMDASGITLADALERIAAQGRVLFLYSNSIVPSEMRVSLQAEHITIVAALTELLVNTDLDVIVSRDNQIALVKRAAPRAPQAPGTVVGTITDAKTHAPIPSVSVSVDDARRTAVTDDSGRYRIAGIEPGTHTVTAQRIGYRRVSQPVTVGDGETATVDFALDQAAGALTQVVVTGTAVPTEVRAVPSHITVVTAKEIEEQNLTTIDQVFRYMVPGGVYRDDTPGIGGYASFSVRGTTTLNGGTSTLKVLVDGIALNDPGSIKLLDPASIDRIEILSGPQASTIYGSGAESGVVQIFTKHGSAGARRPRIFGKVSTQVIDHRYNPTKTPVHDEASIGITGGTDAASYTIDGSWVDEHDFQPYQRGWQPSLHAGVHVQQGMVTADLTLRQMRGTYHPGANVVDPFAAALGQPVTITRPRNRLDLQYATYGATIRVEPLPRWTTTVTLGSDGHGADMYSTYPSSTGTYSVDRQEYTTTSIHVQSSYAGALGPRWGYSAVVGSDRINYAGTQFTAPNADSTEGSFSGADLTGSRTYDHLSGVFGQGQLSWDDALFLTLGVHGDRSPGEDGTYWSPRVGLAYVRDLGGITAKARVAYGQTVVSPSRESRFGFITTSEHRLPNPDLKPTLQRGVDLGAEVYVGSRYSLGITYYDQRADNLIQGYTLPDTDAAGLPQTQAVNIGRIHNTGWELSATLAPVPALDVQVVFGSARSVAESISDKYVGIAKTGDHLPEVPRWTGAVTASWRPLRGTTITGAVNHSATWRELDMYAFARALVSGQFQGDQRPYFIDYPAFTKFNLGASQVITRAVSAYVQVDNVANSYAYERINVIPPMGRTATVGLRFSIE